LVSPSNFDEEAWTLQQKGMECSCTGTEIQACISSWCFNDECKSFVLEVVASAVWVGLWAPPPSAWQKPTIQEGESIAHPFDSTSKVMRGVLAYGGLTTNQKLLVHYCCHAIPRKEMSPTCKVAAKQVNLSTKRRQSNE
jgi:hypothetical protein